MQRNVKLPVTVALKALNETEKREQYALSWLIFLKIFAVC
jgi:hypothetical protein